MQTRKVLTVNQVFDIMLKWVETRRWEAAFHAVIPKRKFQRADKGLIIDELVVAELEDAEEPDGAELVAEASNAGQHQEAEEAQSPALEAVVVSQ